MSILKSNQIATNDTNNVAMDNSLNLKSYTTTQMNALTAAAGDTIYNSTTNSPYFYNGTSWIRVYEPSLVVESLVIAGGGGGAGGSAGGGCLLYTSPSPRDRQKSRMPSSA